MVKDLYHVLQKLFPAPGASWVQRICFFYCIFFVGQFLTLLFGDAGLISFFVLLLAFIIWVNLPTRIQEKMIARLPD